MRALSRRSPSLIFTMQYCGFFPVQGRRKLTALHEGQDLSHSSQWEALPKRYLPGDQMATLNSIFSLRLLTTEKHNTGSAWPGRRHPHFAMDSVRKITHILFLNSQL